MKKMPTLFVREFRSNHEVITHNEVTKGCEWVLAGEGTATEKLDGTCTLFKDGYIWRRYDAKNGKPIPLGAVKCQPEADHITGHLPCWLPIDENNPADKWYIVAYKKQVEDGFEFEEGQTYELCGTHFQNNPYNISGDVYFKHGAKVLKNVPRTFEGIRQYLEEHEIEGIVFHRENGEMCKIKRSDFGYSWKTSKHSEKTSIFK